MFNGYINSVTCSFDSEQGVGITVSCLDAKGLMMAGTHQYLNKPEDKISDVVTKILGNYGLTCTVDEVSEFMRYSASNYQTDYELLVSIARRLNYEFYVSKNKSFFHKAEERADTNYQIGMGRKSVVLFKGSYADRTAE